MNLWVVENLLFTNKHAMGIKYDKLIHTIDVPKTAFNAPSDPIINVPMIMQEPSRKTMHKLDFSSLRNLTYVFAKGKSI